MTAGMKAPQTIAPCAAPVAGCNEAVKAAYRTYVTANQRPTAKS